MQKTFYLSCVILVAFFGPSALAQSAADREAEVTQAAAEEEAAIKANAEMIYKDFSGKVRLFTKDQSGEYEGGNIVGEFTADKKTYLIKLESPKLLEDLKPFDGKTCVLSAKVRNEGKYLVVRKVVLNGAENNFKKRRGGIGM